MEGLETVDSQYGGEMSLSQTSNISFSQGSVGSSNRMTRAGNKENELLTTNGGKIENRRPISFLQHSHGCAQERRINRGIHIYNMDEQRIPSLSTSAFTNKNILKLINNKSISKMRRDRDFDLIIKKEDTKYYCKEDLVLIDSFRRKCFTKFLLIVMLRKNYIIEDENDTNFIYEKENQPYKVDSYCVNRQRGCLLNHPGFDTYEKKRLKEQEDKKKEKENTEAAINQSKKESTANNKRARDPSYLYHMKCDNCKEVYDLKDAAITDVQKDQMTLCHCKVAKKLRMFCHSCNKIKCEHCKNENSQYISYDIHSKKCNKCNKKDSHIDVRTWVQQKKEEEEKIEEFQNITNAIGPAFYRSYTEESDKSDDDSNADQTVLTPRK